MRRVIETITFVALAGAVHLALATLRSAPEGQSAMGEDGEAVISLQAADASLVEMVERWDTPPELAETTPPSMASQPEILPRQADLRPQQPSAPTAPPRPAAPGLALPAPDAAPKRPAAAPPERASMREALASQRPKMRPNRLKRPQREPAAASPAQRASGAGGGANAGSTHNATSASLNAGQQRSLAAHWGAQLRAKIERRKRYPRSAGGAAGTVKVRITVARDGSLQGLALASSSGHPALDQAALQAVQSARRFPAAPKGLSKPSYSFTLPMRFSS